METIARATTRPAHRARARAKTLARATMSAPADAPRNTARRDLLLDLQRRAQARWEETEAFEVDAPARASEAESEAKFFGNFPYPYMNGLLHLGHAFSLSKLEFASAYHRLKGDRTLFPFAFHCTGMPIKACADKITKEIAQYGNPPVFPDESELAAAAEAKAAKEAANAGPTDPTKFVAKKSKASAKKGTQSTQWGIMQASGIPEDEIPSFADSMHWLNYFPPLAKRDVTAMGCQVDWRRSFITTDANPFYDAFVRWQFNTLKKIGKIVKAKRYAVYSPIDGQPCADHDRASGEGVGPQEYLLIKMAVYEECLTGDLAPLKGKKVFLAAATLRPETMYGQTNCWILPDGDYGAYELANGEVLVMCERAALNLSYQEQFAVEGKPKCLLSFKGQALIGCAVESPRAVLNKIYCLPMMTILMNKGTGVVTSVPSDSPDDFMALSDLKAKAGLREKFGVKDEWVMPFEVVPCINIPEFGDACAPKVCAELKIQSQNDRTKLDEAKHRTYLKGFTDGIMLLGEHKGKPVKEAKPIIRQEMIDDKTGLVYSEPERTVMSRSGGECVVALTDQWYLEYGEESWKLRADKCLENMNCYHEEARNGFIHTLGWLRQWACSRSFGLGTRMPWDPQYLIESLSDSTIYMAYYTVAHLLQGGDMFGNARPSVEPELMTDEVWDAIFLGTEKPDENVFPRDLLDRMINEFNYWYPFDLRVSGKDLIQNHLSFAIYNHTAIWEDEKMWPRAFRTNGHLLLNNEKMSKSTGNFKTLKQAIEEFSADAMRFSLADAGDTVEDANFVEDTANAAILRLTKEIAWYEEQNADIEADKLRKTAPNKFIDRVFANAMNIAIAQTQANYENMMFREALKTGFYDLQSARDAYRLMSAEEGGMQVDLVKRFMEVQTLLLAPICPHTCEHIYGQLLMKEGSVTNAGFPVGEPEDTALTAANKYLGDLITNMRKGIAKCTAPPKKGPKGPPKSVKSATVFIASEFVGWRAICLGILSECYEAKMKSFPPVPEILEKVKGSELAGDANFKNVMKMVMPFIKYKMDETNVAGVSALSLKSIFNEIDVLSENIDFIKRALHVPEVRICLTTSDNVGSKADEATPGSPAFEFEVVEDVTEGNNLAEGLARVLLN